MKFFMIEYFGILIRLKVTFYVMISGALCTVCVVLKYRFLIPSAGTPECCVTQGQYRISPSLVSPCVVVLACLVT